MGGLGKFGLHPDFTLFLFFITVRAKSACGTKSVLDYSLYFTVEINQPISKTSYKPTINFGFQFIPR